MGIRLQQTYGKAADDTPRAIPDSILLKFADDSYFAQVLDDVLDMDYREAREHLHLICEDAAAPKY